METQGYKPKKDSKPMEKKHQHIPKNSFGTLHIIFEKFLTNAGLTEICNQSNKYAKSKGNHTFNLTLQKLKSFITILLLSGYNELPRQEMYWKRKEDCHNVLASTLMTKNKFKECKKYLHIADNDNLDPEDIFAKVHRF